MKPSLGGQLVGWIEMVGVAADVAAATAFLAADTTNVLAADADLVLYATKAGDGTGEAELQVRAYEARGQPQAGIDAREHG